MSAQDRDVPQTAKELEDTLQAMGLELEEPSVFDLLGPYGDIVRNYAELKSERPSFDQEHSACSPTDIRNGRHGGRSTGGNRWETSQPHTIVDNWAKVCSAINRCSSSFYGTNLPRVAA